MNKEDVLEERQITLLPPYDTNNQPDIFLYNRKTEQIARVSVNSASDETNGYSKLPTISGDGQYLQNNTSEWVAVREKYPYGTGSWPERSAGRKIIFNSWRNGNRDIYMMNANGSNQIRLTSQISDDKRADWR